MAKDKEFTDESAAAVAQKPRGSDAAEPKAIAHGASIMPRDFSISLAAKGGTDAVLRAPGKERLQQMRGFEMQYVDIIDYIVRITHRIWEEKDIGYIYDTYSQSSHVYDDYGLQYGSEKIVADTVHTINAIPDIRLFADEIIWAGNDEVGFHTSHRTVIKGHNSGYSRYGPPTGAPVFLWCIANCVSLENVIFAEWVTYDTANLIRQLGLDLPTMARKLGNELGERAFEDERFGEAERLRGQGAPEHKLPSSESGFDVEEFIRRNWHNMWNRRSIKQVQESYHRSLLFRGATGRVFYGRGEYQSFVLGMLAMFPDAMLQIDDIYWMGNDDDGYLVSVRWSLVGTHRGVGIYGAPTGRRISMWGIAQQQIERGVITKEWLLFNEFAVMQQIYRD